MIDKMKQISNCTTQKMIFLGLSVFIFLYPLLQSLGIDPDLATFLQVTLLSISLLYFGYFFLVELVNERLSARKRELCYWCIAVLAIAGFIAVLVAEDKVIALKGTDLRGEGFTSIMAYYMIFLVTTLLKERKYRQRILHLFCLFGVIIMVMGVLQYTEIFEWRERFNAMAHVPMQNPNFFGGFSVLFSGVAIGGFLTYNKESKISHPFRFWNRITWYLLVLCGYASCISASSSLVYVGLIMIFLMSIFVEIISRRRRFLPILCIIGGLVVTVCFFDVIKDGGTTRELTSVGEQIKEEGSIFGDGVGTNRMMIWKQYIRLLPKYWLFGSGIEQMTRIYIEEYGLYNGTTYFDKAHNEYLNLWMTEGIFAILSYLVFLFALFIPGVVQFWKFQNRKEETGNENEKRGKRFLLKLQGERESDEVTKIVFFGFFGYIAQAFISISVVQVAPYFWMICGLLYSRKRVEL